MAVTLTEQYARKYLVAAAQDEIWYESMAGTLTQVTDAVVDTSDQLMMFELFQKAFVLNGSILGVVDFKNTKLTCSALTTAPAPGDILTQDTSGAVMVVDYVNAAKTAVYGYTTNGTFNATKTVSSNNENATMDPSTFTPSAVAQATTMPHWYPWTKQPGLTVALPAKAYLGCRYNGRAVIAGDPNAPHQWYMSRQGDPFDFDYTDNTDAQSPVTGQDVDAGIIGDIIRSLMPYHDDYLVFGCANSLYWLQGDPMSGGSLATITDATGVFGAQSWCWGNGGKLYFWGTNGIYSWTPGQKPINISQYSLPKLIKDEAVNPSTHRIIFGWDRERHGISVTITLLADGTNSNYFVTINETGDGMQVGFFPETYPEECGVYASFYYESNDPTKSGLLYGCKDGYVRTFDDDAKSDDIGPSDEAISSHVVIGPMPLSNDPDSQGSFSAPNLELAGGGASGSMTDSNNVTFEVYKGISASKIVETIAAGGNPNFAATVVGPGGRPGRTMQCTMSGQYVAMLLKNNTAAQSWSMERLTAHIQRFKRRS